VQISKHFPSDFRTFFEPFLGSGAILATVSPQNGFGSDVFKPLMDIWKMLKDNPEELINWYAERRNMMHHLSKDEVYLKILKSYNSNPNGADFLFLSRACYGGIVRFRKSDGFMSTPCGVHEPISVENFKKRVDEWKFRLKNVIFYQCDYKEAFSLAKTGDFIYCDPPYSHSQSILYGAQDFRLTELFMEIDKATTKGVRIALSIDGHKKSGDYICDLPIPQGLFKTEVFINCGTSMLRRFQLEGQILNNENVSDRLLLTYDL
jgi:DNA adenine methylase